MHKELILAGTVHEDRTFKVLVQVIEAHIFKFQSECCHLISFKTELGNNIHHVFPATRDMWNLRLGTRGI